MRRIASIVATASPRRSSSPVDSGNVSASKIRSLARRPYRVGGEIVDAVGDLHLPLDVACLALLVDQQADDRGAVLGGQAHHTIEARALAVPVLEVRGVEDGATTDVVEARLHHVRFRGVEDERHARLRREARGEVSMSAAPSRPT